MCFIETQAGPIWLANKIILTVRHWSALDNSESSRCLISIIARDNWNVSQREIKKKKQGTLMLAVAPAQTSRFEKEQTKKKRSGNYWLC